MSATFKILDPFVDQFGGKGSRLKGNAMLAFFSSPTSYEDGFQKSLLVLPSPRMPETEKVG